MHTVKQSVIRAITGGLPTSNVSPNNMLTIKGYGDNIGEYFNNLIYLQILGVCCKYKHHEGFAYEPLVDAVNQYKSAMSQAHSNDYYICKTWGELYKYVSCFAYQIETEHIKEERETDFLWDSEREAIKFLDVLMNELANKSAVENANYQKAKWDLSDKSDAGIKACKAF
jgi:hypothetical protein